MSPAISELTSLPGGFEDLPEATSLAGGRFPHPKRPTPPKDAKVTKYELPTFLGSAQNESLAVNVYQYRVAFGKGPSVKSITVGHVGQDEHEYVKVLVGDGVAWGGAVHVSISASARSSNELS